MRHIGKSPLNWLESQRDTTVSAKNCVLSVTNVRLCRWCFGKLSEMPGFCSLFYVKENQNSNFFLTWLAYLVWEKHPSIGITLTHCNKFVQFGKRFSVFGSIGKVHCIPCKHLQCIAYVIEAFGIFSKFLSGEQKVCRCGQHMLSKNCKK